MRLLDRLAAWLHGRKSRDVDPDPPPVGEVLDFRKPPVERSLEDVARDLLEEGEHLIRWAEAHLDDARRRRAEDEEHGQE